jgi:UDP-N-acetylmuramate dehydrogenase
MQALKSESSMPSISGTVTFNEPMSAHTSFGIGGPADIYAEPRDVAETVGLIKWARKANIPVFALGSGSNLLVADRGIRGLVIKLGDGFKSIHVCGTTIVAGASAKLPMLVRTAVEADLEGLEGLTGIPGCVGGAVCMNAGTPAGSVQDTLVSLKAVDLAGNVLELPADELDLRYRSSVVCGRGLMILEARFELRRSESGMTETINSLLASRRNSQPIGARTAGSVFKNPDGDYAAKILDELGAKGMQAGGARVTEKHANFIENVGDASAADVSNLILKLQSLALEKRGIELVPEIRMVGEW